MTEGLSKGPEQQPIEIEVGELSDWQAYRDIRTEAVTKNPEAYGATLEKISARKDKEWQGDLLEKERFYVFAKKDGSLTGAVSMAGSFKAEKKVWRVIAVYTRPEFRGKGLSEKVIRKILEEIKKRGGTRATLNVTLRTEQDPARAMYAKLGFKEVGTSLDKGEVISDMELDLSSTE